MKTIAQQFKEMNQQIKSAYEKSGTKRNDIESLWYSKTFKSEIVKSENNRTFKVTFSDNSEIEFSNNNLI